MKLQCAWRDSLLYRWSVTADSLVSALTERRYSRLSENSSSATQANWRSDFDDACDCCFEPEFSRCSPHACSVKRMRSAAAGDLECRSNFDRTTQFARSGCVFLLSPARNSITALISPEMIARLF